MIGPDDIDIFLICMANGIEKPFGMAWRAGEVSCIVDDQHRATDARSIAQTVGIAVIKAPLR